MTVSQIVLFEYELEAPSSVRFRSVTPDFAWVTTLVTTQTGVRGRTGFGRRTDGSGLYAPVSSSRVAACANASMTSALSPPAET